MVSNPKYFHRCYRLRSGQFPLKWVHTLVKLVNMFIWDVKIGSRFVIMPLEVGIHNLCKLVYMGCKNNFEFGYNKHISILLNNTSRYFIFV
jgi:hypothetical protein